ncbi:MAG: hypothetical protein K0R67_3746 [Paenibacillus sp.]|jgi:hypothetical protein|nr:hypothetical protein [Paenibacillus sp.]
MPSKTSANSQLTGSESGGVDKVRRLETDVLIVGGGTAGVTAALAAAANGTTRVLLADSSGGIGGVGTHSGIHAYYLGLHVGVQTEMDKRIWTKADELKSKAKGFHPEAKKIVLLELLQESGVEILYECVAVEVLMEDRRVTGVVFESPTETIRVDARITLDSTGNGDICTLAGVSYSDGRQWDGVMHCYSVPPRYLNDKGLADFRNFDAGWVDPSSTRDVTRALISGRQLLWQLPQLANDGFIAIPPLLGVREGRLFHGEYTLTLEDLIMDQRFDDVVMKCFSHYDTHAKDMANESQLAQWWTEVMGAWSQRVGCDVPYRSFVPKATEGLLIACRALSLDHDAAAALRMQPDMHAVGEVAGTAAAMCCETGQQPRVLDVVTLQNRLVERGVLHQDDLTRDSAPWVTMFESKREERLWTLATVQQPESLHKLAGALGTDEEGKALWWLWKAGDKALPVLKDLYENSTGRPRRGAAIALGLLGDRTGVPELIRAVEQEDADGLPGFESRIPPSWLGCLVTLKHLKETSCVRIVLAKLETDVTVARLPGFARTLHILQYLIEVTPHLSEATRKETIRSVELLLADPDLGKYWGGGLMAPVSIRWNLDMTASYLLGILGRHESAKQILEQYQNDDRKYARNMSNILTSRLSEATPFIGTGRVNQA